MHAPAARTIAPAQSQPLQPRRRCTAHSLRHACASATSTNTAGMIASSPRTSGATSDATRRARRPSASGRTKARRSARSRRPPTVGPRLLEQHPRVGERRDRGARDGRPERPALATRAPGERVDREDDRRHRRDAEVLRHAVRRAGRRSATPAPSRTWRGSGSRTARRAARHARSRRSRARSASARARP